jgi:hypothetical protein
MENGTEITMYENFTGRIDHVRRVNRTEVSYFMWSWNTELRQVEIDKSKVGAPTWGSLLNHVIAIALTEAYLARVHVEIADIMERA